jgi:ATP-dependent DNA ligase
MKPGIMVDGELYIHKTHLQIISGIVRGSDIESKKKLNYMIFDIYDESHKNLTFSQRYDKLEHMFKNHNKSLIIAPTYKLGNSKDFVKNMNKKYKEFLDEGYEGLVLRRDLPYEPAYHDKHSDAVFKHKPMRTKEFKIIDFGDGRGKDSGKLIWICDAGGNKFSVRPKMSDIERSRLFREFKAGAFNKVKGKMLTIEYDSLSIDGIPLQPRALVIRDYE